MHTATLETVNVAPASLSDVTSFTIITNLLSFCKVLNDSRFNY